MTGILYIEIFISLSCLDWTSDPTQVLNQIILRINFDPQGK
jgi:hypothetical protein